MKLNNICCIGGDILGRTMCIAIAFKCPEIRVIVLDDEEAISAKNSESMSVFGSGFEQMLKKCQHRNLFFSSFYESAIKEADLIFLSVRVPIKNLKERKQVIVDFKELEEATKLIALYSESDKIVVEKSDVPVKAVEKISWILKSSSKTGFQFRILSIPSYINQKFSVEDILYPERIVIGCQSNPSGRAAAQSLCEVFEYWIPKKNILILSHWSAGLYKIISNSFLAQKRCSLNSITAICEETGGDLSKIITILSRDSRIGPKYLKPSVELETFQEDTSNLIFMYELLNLNEAAEYWKALLELNEFFMNRFFARIKTVLGSVEGQEITVWGVKVSNGERRKPSSLLTCEWLLHEKSNLRIHDPDLQAQDILMELNLEDTEDKDRRVQIYNDIYLSIHNSSAVLICTKKEEFVQIDYSKLNKWMKRPLMIDRFRLFDNEVLKKYGIEYFTLGSKIGKDIEPQF